MKQSFEMESAHTWANSSKLAHTWAKSVIGVKWFHTPTASGSCRSVGMGQREEKRLWPQRHTNTNPVDSISISCIGCNVKWITPE